MLRDNWDDLRFILAVTEEGTLSGAAKRLEVNHATVLRRVAQFEESSGIELFDKTLRGYALRREHGAIIEAARQVESSVQLVERLLVGRKMPLSGVVRITASDSLSQSVLTPILAQMATELPDIFASLISSDANFDLARVEAEIIVRPAPAVPNQLVARSPAKMGFGLFRARKSGVRNCWLELSGIISKSPPARWMADNVPDAQMGGGAESFGTIREMTASGLGLGALPNVIGEADVRLERVWGAMPDLSVPIWVANHADFADVPRIIVVRDYLCDALARQAQVLLGSVQTQP